MTQPQRLWACWIGVYGSAFKRPRRVTFGGGGRYWDRTGNNDVLRAGWNQRHYDSTYADTDKQAVQLVIDGAQATRAAILRAMGAKP